MFLDNITINALGQYLGFFLPSSRVYYLYLITALLLAFFAYRFLDYDHDHHHEGDHGKGEENRKHAKSFFSYVFDPEIYRHPSTWQDIKYFLVNAILYYGVASQFLIGTHEIAALGNTAFNEFFGPLSSPLISNELSLILYTLLSVLAIDLGVYVTHRAQHEIPFLWEFHKVHHSAEKLNPMTLFRMHPVDLFFTALVVSILTGLSVSGLFYLTGETPQELTLFGINVITALFYIFGYNLRHSHIWLNYPAWLSRIFISPAQHQIHHSVDPKHFDKNFGLIFSIWDGLGRSLYIPRTYEKLEYGLSKEEPNPFRSTFDIYKEPFVAAGRIFAKETQKPSRRVIAGLSVFILGMGYVQLANEGNRQIALAELPSVHLAELTWTEIDHALQTGYDTALIPTAGVEQNGPHVVLGKHNLVVKRTSGDIAKTLGKTLVAPVVDHVPEGAIAPEPDGHMAFAGTISVPDDVFEDILYASAASLKAHGFKKIFLVGDSGGNQEGQARVARKLQNEWRGEGMIVAHIGDYYSGNGQFDYLLGEGYTDAEIGYHAGIRDTSEVLFIAPASVRPHGFTRYVDGDSGFSGNRAKASADIGRKMVELKVKAAVDEIRQVLAESDRKVDENRMVRQDLASADQL
ncbi:MAG: creatininase family protein [Pseudomonadota bacterium]